MPPPRPGAPPAAPARWTYEAAVRHLLSFVNYEALAGARAAARRPADLERFSRALRRLGNPERTAPAIHIGGTNGKGSAAAIAASLLGSLGIRAGLYTSPHLVEMRERVRVDGRPIGRGEFARAARDAAAVVGGVEGGGFRTTFEILTALAFLAFRARRVEAMVVEVGLGGRLDSTRVVAPKVVVMTSISLDHTEVLGADLATIAADKAGIFKRGVPALSARQEPVVMAELFRRARRRGAPLEDSGRMEVLDARPTPRGEALSLRTPLGLYPDLLLPLKGVHQQENAALALRAVEIFAGGALDPVAVRRGFRAVRWPGRFEVIGSRPPVVVDGAHNPGGAARLAATLERYYPGRRAVFLLGISKGKDAAGILAALAPRAGAVVAVAAAHPRAEDPERVIALARRVIRGPVETARNTVAGLERARRLAGPDGLVCAAGSLYLVGDVLRLWPALKPGRGEGGPAKRSGRPRG